MDKTRGTCTSSVALDVSAEMHRRRSIQLSREKAMSARNHGIVRSRNTCAVAPMRTTVNRHLTASPQRKKKNGSIVRSTSVSTNATAATPRRPSTPRQGVSVNRTVTKSPVLTPRRRALSTSTAGRGGSPTPMRPFALSPLGATCASPKQSCHSSFDFAPSTEKKSDKKEVVQHNVPFVITGPYTRIAVVGSSAAIWAVNGKTGTIDVFSTISGKMTTQIPARVSSSGGISKPVALMASSHHVWAGFDDGAVVIYDHLCVTPLTMGLFHATSVVAFCVLGNGTTVSGSVDMTLVQWDKEEKNFEAITRILGVSESTQTLTCMTALDANIALCGSMEGHVILVDCASGTQITTLRGHTKRVNALVVMENLLFSAAEDACVNVWNLQGNKTLSDFSFQRNGKLLKRVSVQVPVRDLVPHEHSHSLWVAYADGLVERWSTNPDDDFGVEQVVREAFIDLDDFQRHQDQRPELWSLHNVGAVETMRVLALSSNGTSKVWCGHRNIVEESLQDSINKINAVITEECTEASAWEEKVRLLKQKEMERKTKYCALLCRLHTRCLLSGYYKRWQSRVASSRSRGNQQDVFSNTLRECHRFRLLRRYFTIWCRFYDWEQRRYRRMFVAATLERLSHQLFVARVLSRWRGAVMRRKSQQQQQDLVKTLLRVSNGVLLGKFFARWRYAGSVRRGTVPEDKLLLLAGKSRQHLLQQTYECWRSRNAQRETVREGGVASATKHSAQNLAFAEAYARVTAEREQRCVFLAWRRWHKRRRKISLMRPLAVAAEKRCQRDLMYRALVSWQLYCRKNCLDRKALEVQDVEKRLRQTEETHADIDTKLQLQKRLDYLRRQYEQEQQQLQEKMEETQRLSTECDALRQSLDKISAADGGCGVAGDETAAAAASSVFFNPNVLRQMPIEEAMSLVMTRLKSIVLNIYTDMSLLSQINDRLRRSSTTAVLFFEGFQEVKRVVVALSKKPAGGAWRCGERWSFTAEALDDLPPHLCASVLQGMKAMAVSYDMLDASEVETLTTTRAEIVTNADLLFLLWRASYAARRPPLPANKRVVSRC